MQPHVEEVPGQVDVVGLAQREVAAPEGRAGAPGLVAEEAADGGEPVERRREQEDCGLPADSALHVVLAGVGVFGPVEVDRDDLGGVGRACRGLGG